MATIAKAVEGYIASRRFKCTFVAPLGTADDTVPIRPYNVESLTVEVTGTSGAATLVIEGSTDGVTYSTLHDQDGTDLNFVAVTVPRIENVRECNTPFIRARTSAGVATALTVVFVGEHRG